MTTDHDRSDAIILTWRGVDGTGRRYVFEPRWDDTYERIEQTWTNGEYWRTVGREIVESVSVETPA